jgi:hypothetical protein
MLLTTDNVVRAKQPKTTKAPLRNMYIVIQPMSVTYMHAYPFTQETCMHTYMHAYMRIHLLKNLGDDAGTDGPASLAERELHTL